MRIAAKLCAMLRQKPTAALDTAGSSLNYRITNDGYDGTVSWGYHLNFGIGRKELTIGQFAPLLAAYIGTLSAFGSGIALPDGDYQIMQKTTHTRHFMGRSNTDVPKVVINTRDEPHANPEKYLRVHMVGNDHSNSPYISWLRAGMFYLAAVLPKPERLKHVLPSEAEIAMDAFGGRIGRDLSPLIYNMEANRQYTELDYSEMVLELVIDAYAKGNIRHTPDNTRIITAWSKMHRMRKTDDPELDKMIEWRAKLNFLNDQSDKYESAKGAPLSGSQRAALGAMLPDIEKRTIAASTFQDMFVGDAWKYLAEAQGTNAKIEQERASTYEETAPDTRASHRGQVVMELYSGDQKPKVFGWDRYILYTGGPEVYYLAPEPNGGYHRVNAA